MSTGAISVVHSVLGRSSLWQEKRVSARRIAPEWVAIEAREIFFCSKVRASAMQGLTPSKKEQQVITEAHGKIDIMHHHYYNPLISCQSPTSWPIRST